MRSPLDIFALTLTTAPDSTEGVEVRYHAPSYAEIRKAIRWAERQAKLGEDEDSDPDYLYTMARLALSIDDVRGLTRNGHAVPWPALPDLSDRVKLLEALPTAWVRRLQDEVGKEGELAPEEESSTSAGSL